MTTVLCVSASKPETERLVAGGPRRDFVELAAAVNARIIYRSPRPSRKGLAGRIAGPHMKQSFATAGKLSQGDICFADGEHLGIPLLAFLFARRKRGVRVVMLGHLVDRPWKRFLLAATTRLSPHGRLVVHSQTQVERIRGWVAKSWLVDLVPYQVDTTYWERTVPASQDGLPVILAVGSENRDYDTLAEAVAGLPVKVLIAAGSHWARQTAGAASLPDNVRYLDKPLSFDELRQQYTEASMVVVPLQDVTNQSGVTVILEAMSMGTPVVVTATRGQRECIAGPLVLADGSVDESATAARGPQIFGDSPDRSATGIYVPPADPLALRAAIVRLLNDPDLGHELGMAARDSATRHFSIERYVETLAGLLKKATDGRTSPMPAGEPAL